MNFISLEMTRNATKFIKNIGDNIFPIMSNITEYLCYHPHLADNKDLISPKSFF